MSQFNWKLDFDTNGLFKGIHVVIGGVSEIEKPYGVDAISGGTITSKGLEEMIMKENPDIQKNQKSITPYIPFLKTLQNLILGSFKY